MNDTFLIYLPRRTRLSLAAECGLTRIGARRPSTRAKRRKPSLSVAALAYWSSSLRILPAPSTGWHVNLAVEFALRRIDSVSSWDEIKNANQPERVRAQAGR